MAEATGNTAYQAVFDAIAAGRIKPGERLRETELAEMIGLSRTPIREAIRRLESEGLVSHEPRIGAVVKSLTQQEIVELYEMRIVLETTAASMAAKHASAAEIRHLENLNAQMLDAADVPVQVSALNQRFHGCIVNAARNRFLAQSYRNLANSLILLGQTTLETPERVKSVNLQHIDIIDALSKGDAKEAAVAMSVHMETSLDHRLGGLQE
jgi:DNA-binding GntR family transcriptional regulator